MIIDYNDNGDSYTNSDARAKLSTVRCECGNSKLMVNFIPAKFMGGYLKVFCNDCGQSRQLLDQSLNYDPNYQV